ncbi:MAG: TPM domain-containing protein [Proteobacteria bacterium]|nr:TPM domain-containing protein [Pseudomonadota bacterium]MBU4582126.1 TPM domain-containing protein [Pseudomonadota bacterium]MCG2739436.1 TPM domain-containing protein [Syntrophaceae bacterium]
MWSPSLCSVLRKIASTAGFLCLICLFIFICAELVEPFPSPTGAVNDFAGVIPVDVANRMSRISQEVLRKTGTSIVVATVESIGDKTPDTYATELFNTWGIGKKGENKGVLIFLTLKERRIVIRTGYGIERILTDRLCGQILDQRVIPYFKKGDYGTGLGNAIVAVAQIIAKDAGVTLTGR